MHSKLINNKQDEDYQFYCKKNSFTAKYYLDNA